MGEDFLKAELERIKDLGRADNYAAAWQLLEKLTAENPQEPNIWNTRAYLHSRNTFLSKR